MALFSAARKGTTNREQQLAVKLTGNEKTDTILFTNPSTN
jgi:hypothetical protein